MSREIEMRVMFRVTFPDGTTMDARSLELADDENGTRVVAGDRSGTWNNIAGIAVVRIPVVVERTSMIPPAGG